MKNWKAIVSSEYAVSNLGALWYEDGSTWCEHAGPSLLFILMLDATMHQPIFSSQESVEPQKQIIKMISPALELPAQG